MRRRVGPPYVTDRPPQYYAPVGSCIYCGAAPSGDEHIIALGLGGRWVLPDASCRKCEGITSAIEGACLRGMFRGARAYLDLPTRRPKEQKEMWAPVTIKGRDASHRLPKADYPAILVLPAFTDPGILGGKPGVRAIWTIGFPPHWPELRKRGISSYGVTFDTYRLGQLLAKIAHSFITAEIGLANFEPLLLEHIKAKPPPSPHWLIGTELRIEPPAFTLHTLRTTAINKGGVDYVAARIRLFAFLKDSPTYVVVAGTSAVRATSS